MRRTRTPAITATLVLAVACTAPDNQPNTTPTTSTTSSPATTTTPTEPEPPQLPTAAHHKTTAGAKAFITYYIDTLNHGVTRNTTTALQDVPIKGCEICEKLVKTIHTNQRRGGIQRGGTWTAVNITMIGLQSENPVAIADLDVEQGYYKRYPTDRRHVIKARRIVYEFWLNWNHKSWALTDVKPV